MEGEGDEIDNVRLNTNGKQSMGHSDIKVKWNGKIMIRVYYHNARFRTRQDNYIHI